MSEGYTVATTTGKLIIRSLSRSRSRDHICTYIYIYIYTSDVVFAGRGEGALRRGERIRRTLEGHGIMSCSQEALKALARWGKAAARFLGQRCLTVIQHVEGITEVRSCAR